MRLESAEALMLLWMIMVRCLRLLGWMIFQAIRDMIIGIYLMTLMLFVMSLGFEFMSVCMSMLTTICMISLIWRLLMSDTILLKSGYAKSGVYWEVHQYKLRYATLYETRVNGQAQQFRSKAECFAHLTDTGVTRFNTVMPYDRDWETPDFA